MPSYYFPYTHMRDDALDLLSACFPSVHIYQPTQGQMSERLQARQQEGALSVRYPTRQFDVQICERLQSFQTLGELYGGKKGGTANFPPPGVPFHQEEGALNIRSEVGRALHDTHSQPPETESATDLLIQAAVFLQLAQDLDCHQEEIDRNLTVFQEMERNLFGQMKGDERDPLLEGRPDTIVPASRSWGHMLPERLAAWARLFILDQQTNGDQQANGKTTAGPDDPLILVTTAPTAFEEILSRGPDAVRFQDLRLDPSGTEDREAVTTWLSRLAAGSNLESAENETPLPSKSGPVVIRAAVIPALSPSDLLALHAGMSPRQGNPEAPHPMQKNAVVCLVSR